MKLTDYVPKLYENNIEMTNLSQSLEDELEIYLKFDIDEAFLNQFIKTADKNGIEHYEEMLDLKPDENYNNLDYRRARIITKLTTRAPLSIRWLEQSLTSLVGENNFRIEVDNDKYLLSIQISGIYNDTALLVTELYRELIPANMVLDVKLFETALNKMYIGAYAHEGEFITIKSEEG